MTKQLCATGPGRTTLVDARAAPATGGIAGPGKPVAVAAGAAPALTPAGQCAAMLRTANGALSRARAALAGAHTPLEARAALANAERALRIVARERRAIIAPEVDATWRRLEAERAALEAAIAA